MPKRHGIYRSLPPGLPKGTKLTADQTAVFRFGIGQVLEALRMGPFLPLSDQIKVAKLQHHIWEVNRRFLYSLQHLNELMQRMSNNFAHEHLSPDSVQVDLEAGCQADHVLTYLGTIVDDIAQLIVLATRLKHPKQRTESMGDLKHVAVIGLPALSPVRSLLAELENPGTWWELAFKPHRGARQLLVHNHNLVSFQGSQPPGGSMEATASLLSPYDQPVFNGDFFRLLREILTSLCGWLDRLEDTLVQHLRVLNPSWLPMSHCPFILLGLGFPATGVHYHPVYFPIPLCEGADPLPWTIGPPVCEGEAEA